MDIHMTTGFLVLKWNTMLNGQYVLIFFYWQPGHYTNVQFPKFRHVEPYLFELSVL